VKYLCSNLMGSVNHSLWGEVNQDDCNYSETASVKTRELNAGSGTGCYVTCTSLSGIGPDDEGVCP
jgi:hypothetical protein